MSASLVLGTPAKIASLVTTITTSQTFSIEPKQAGGDFRGYFQFVGTLGPGVIDLQISLDGGTTWQVLQAALQTLANDSVLLFSGALYRLNFSTAPTSVDAWVVVN